MDKEEVDRYLTESLLSFKKAESKNGARRGSLLKKTKGLELQQKMANAKMSKEERQLRESLRMMKVEQNRNTIVRDAVAKSREFRNKKTERPVKKCPSADVDPYPVTFPSIRSSSPSHCARNPSSPSKSRPKSAMTKKRSQSSLTHSPAISPSREKANNAREEKAFLQAARTRGRRVSREFEDLDVDTRTGSLNALKLGSPQTVTSRFLSRGNSMNEFSGSTSSLSSVEELYWAGEPEAITSVRRPRKTSEQQTRDAIIKKSLTDVNVKQ